MKKLIKILLVIDLAVIFLGYLITGIVDSDQLRSLIWELPALCGIYSILILLISYIFMKLYKKLKARYLQKSGNTNDRKNVEKPVAQPVDTEMICPVCQNVCRGSSRFCDNCGSKLPEPVPQSVAAEMRCPVCQTACRETSRFCFHCGSKLQE